MAIGTARKAGRSLLDALLSWAYEDEKPWSMVMEVAATWSCIWPRPEVVPDGALVLQLNVQSGFLDMSPFLDLWCSPTCPCWALAWRKAFAQHVQIYRQLVGLTALMEAGAKCEKLQPFFGQLAYRIAVELEHRLGAAGKDGASLARIKFAWKHPLDANLGLGVERLLVQYNSQGVAACSGHFVFGLPTDKATIAGLPLQMTCVVLPTNIAILCPPGAPQY